MLKRLILIFSSFDKEVLMVNLIIKHVTIAITAFICLLSVMVQTGIGQVSPKNYQLSDACADDIYWDSSITPFSWSWPPTVSVKAMTVYNSELIVAGRFVLPLSGGDTAYNIAAWDGESWYSLGAGLRGDTATVYALTVYHGKLIAGGAFTSAGGIPAEKIAAWDGNAWSPLGSGMGPYVYALEVYRDALIAGGYFTSAGGTSANCIAAWDGASWSALGSGMGGDYPYVYALTVYDTLLIAGGKFGVAGGISAYRLAAWNGDVWSAAGPGFDSTSGDVRCLKVFDDCLVIGGGFSKAGYTILNKIAIWDRHSWSSLGSGLTGSNAGVFALADYDGRLFCGGSFTVAGATPSNYIAMWDGDSWYPLGSGLGNDWPYVNALTTYDNKLVVGGDFALAGGKPSAFIALWTKGYPTDVSEDDKFSLPANYQLSQNYPNPFNPSTTIEFDLPRRSHVSVTVYNVLGREVSRLINRELPIGNHQITWDGSTDSGAHASTGVYFYRIKAAGHDETKKMLLLK